MMKIDGLNVEEFASGEHQGLQIDGIDGDNLLLSGGSRTGKTLTFNAILYTLLGAHETIDLSTGRSNRVTLELSDGITFKRGQPQAEYDDGETRLVSEEALNQLAEDLGDPNLIKQHFLHSHIQYLPLYQISNDARLRVIRWVTNQAIEINIRRHERAVEQLEVLVRENEDRDRRLDEQLDEIDQQISDVESQIEKFEELHDRIESGQVEEIRDQLEENQELEERLGALFDREEDIRQTLRKKRRLKRKQEHLSDEVKTVIAEAVNDFVCPACDRRISTNKAETRLEQGYCPYCGREHPLDELKQEIRGRVEQSDEILSEIDQEIEELVEERDEIRAEIQSIREDRPELSDLDGFTRRKLKQNEYSIEDLRTEVADELQNLRDRYEELVGESEELEQEDELNTEKLEVYRESLSAASNHVEQLKQDGFETGVQEFTDTWEAIYNEMSPEIGLQINLTEEGDIQLPGRNTLREYDASGELSSSEVRLLNLSFAYTLNQFAVESGLIDWDTFVLDEPFDNMDAESRQEVIDFANSSDKQFIVTTSNENLENQFVLVEDLERDPIQTQLDDFND